MQGILVNSDPARFFVPKYVGSKGWVGVRLDLAEPPDWEEMAEIIYESYCLLAPARLVREWEADSLRRRGWGGGEVARLARTGGRGRGGVAGGPRGRDAIGARVRGGLART